MLKLYALRIAAACLFVFPWSLATAEDAQTIADVRCIAVALQMSNMSGSQQMSGTMLALYYVGRLDSRTPNLDLESVVLKEMGKMTPADYVSEAKRCSVSLTEKGQQFTQLGKDLIERGHQLQNKPAS